jgi:hypothetical protein
MSAARAPQPSEPARTTTSSATIRIHIARAHAPAEREEACARRASGAPLGLSAVGPRGLAPGPPRGPAPGLARINALVGTVVTVGRVVVVGGGGGTVVTGSVVTVGKVVVVGGGGGRVVTGSVVTVGKVVVVGGGGTVVTGSTVVVEQSLGLQMVVVPRAVVVG